MKKLLISLLLAFAMLFTAVGCGEYNPVDPPSQPPVTPTPTPGVTDPSDTFEEKDGVYSVRLAFDDKPLERNEETEAIFVGLEAQWSNGATVYRSTFDENGIARMQNLDGEYAVTLHGLADTHRYNPNGHEASGDNEDIEIEVFEFIATRGNGASTGNPISVSRFGAYTATIKAAGHTVYYRFTPSIPGKYVIQTIEDVTANSVNPVIDTYNANAGGFAQFNETINTGGDSAEYTKNAKWDLKLTRDMVGNIFVFGIKATQRESVYPVTVTFIIKYAGEYNPPVTQKKVIVADQAALTARGIIGQPTGTIKYTETKIAGTADYEFKLSNYAYNADDGLWHVADGDGNPTGPILYAQITKPNRFLPDHNGSPVSFNTVESVSGTGVLTLANGTETWKVFIEGGASVTDPNNPVLGLESYGGYRGLADMIGPANVDGVYPVTAEVKEFLQKYAVNQRFFNDGNGWAETTATDVFGYRIFATEDAQWLFGACYYV